MKKFNEIKSKFETDFDAIKEKNTEEPEYENMGAIPQKGYKPYTIEEHIFVYTKKAA